LKKVESRKLSQHKMFYFDFLCNRHDGAAAIKSLSTLLHDNGKFMLHDNGEQKIIIKIL